MFERLDIDTGGAMYLPFAQSLLRKLKVWLNGTGLKQGRKSSVAPDGTGTILVSTRRGPTNIYAVQNVSVPFSPDGRVDEWLDSIHIALTPPESWAVDFVPIQWSTDVTPPAYVADLYTDSSGFRKQRRRKLVQIPDTTSYAWAVAAGRYVYSDGGPLVWHVTGQPLVTWTRNATIMVDNSPNPPYETRSRYVNVVHVKGTTLTLGPALPTDQTQDVTLAACVTYSPTGVRYTRIARARVPAGGHSLTSTVSILDYLGSALVSTTPVTSFADAGAPVLAGSKAEDTAVWSADGTQLIAKTSSSKCLLLSVTRPDVGLPVVTASSYAPITSGTWYETQKVGFTSTGTPCAVMLSGEVTSSGPFTYYDHDVTLQQGVSEYWYYRTLHIFMGATEFYNSGAFLLEHGTDVIAAETFDINTFPPTWGRNVISSWTNPPYEYDYVVDNIYSNNRTTITDRYSPIACVEADFAESVFVLRDWEVLGTETLTSVEYQNTRNHSRLVLAEAGGGAQYFPSVVIAPYSQIQTITPPPAARTTVGFSILKGSAPVVTRTLPLVVDGWSTAVIDADWSASRNELLVLGRADAGWLYKPAVVSPPTAEAWYDVVPNPSEPAVAYTLIDPPEPLNLSHV